MPYGIINEMEKQAVKEMKKHCQRQDSNRVFVMILINAHR